jgi:hypothetical protein
MLKGASAEGRAKPLKLQCRVSSRSTLPCFLFSWGTHFQIEMSSLTRMQGNVDIRCVNYGDVSAIGSATYAARTVAIK